MPYSQEAHWIEKAATLKEAVFVKLDSMPDTLRTMAPAPGEWSAADVVQHLILVEENVAGLWRQRLLELPSLQAGFKSSLLSTIVTFVFSKTSVRVPTVPELEPKEPMGTVELRERWGTARTKLIAALPDDPNTAWILHPVFGPLTSNQMGKLLTAHLKHHLRHWPTPSSKEIK